MSSHELFEYPLRTDFSAHIILAVVVLFVTIFEFNVCWVDVCWADVCWAEVEEIGRLKEIVPFCNVLYVLISKSMFC